MLKPVKDKTSPHKFTQFCKRKEWAISHTVNSVNLVYDLLFPRGKLKAQSYSWTAEETTLHFHFMSFSSHYATWHVYGVFLLKFTRRNRWDRGHASVLLVAHVFFSPREENEKQGNLLLSLQLVSVGGGEVGGLQESPSHILCKTSSLASDKLTSDKDYEKPI